MTEWTTEWLAGMLAIASAIMCVGLWPLIKLEIGESDMPWYRNRALRLSLALWIHGLGALVLFGSAMFTKVSEVPGLALWLVWSTFGLWLVAKTLIVSVSGWFKTCLVLFGLWTAGCALWSVFH